MTDRKGNEYTEGDTKPYLIEGKKCPVDDQVYSSFLTHCPEHGNELMPIDPDEDEHLL